MSNNSGKTQFLDLDNARYDDQRQVMAEIIEAGHCPFCLEYFTQYQTEPIELDGEHWLVTHNRWPYEHTQLHFLLIHKQHIESLQELTPEAGAELASVLGELEKKYRIPGGGFAMRFGDTDYSAGSVRHLHAQLIIPAITEPDFEPTRFKIGKTRKK